jgi:hypothetical protein
VFWPCTNSRWRSNIYHSMETLAEVGSERQWKDRKNQALSEHLIILSVSEAELWSEPIAFSVYLGHALIWATPLTVAPLVGVLVFGSLREMPQLKSEVSDNGRNRKN